MSEGSMSPADAGRGELLLMRRLLKQLGRVVKQRGAREMIYLIPPLRTYVSNPTSYNSSGTP
jgi:hypothetical protein